MSATGSAQNLVPQMHFRGHFSASLSSPPWIEALHAVIEDHSGDGGKGKVLPPVGTPSFTVLTAAGELRTGQSQR